MPDPENQTLVVLVSVIAGLLFFCVVILFRLSARLVRIERILNEKPKPRQKLEQSDVQSRGGAFGQFLADHPELIPLAKSEQFAAFRKWRKEQGLNWEGR